MVEAVNISYTRDSYKDMFVIDDQPVLIYTWIVYSIVCQMFNVFGVVTNVINIVCFVSQGFKESINISLLGLSISDLGSLTTMLWSCISMTPAVVAADLPFDPIEVTYLTSAMPHFVFTRVSSCITALIALERCLCIIIPLQIKRIATPDRAAVIITSFFIVNSLSAAPIYTVNKLRMKFSPVRNKTIFGLVFIDDRENVELITFIINNFSIPLTAFVIIIVCSIILSLKLHNNSKWRMKMTIDPKADRMSTRNQKASKMVVMISILFIVCFIPVCTNVLALAFVPALSLEGKYINLSIVILGLGYVMEGINSSMNIFFYYHMSSNYRDQFCKLFYMDRIRQHGMKQLIIVTGRSHHL